MNRALDPTAILRQVVDDHWENLAFPERNITQVNFYDVLWLLLASPHPKGACFRELGSVEVDALAKVTLALKHSITRSG